MALRRTVPAPAASTRVTMEGKTDRGREKQGEMNQNKRRCNRAAWSRLGGMGRGSGCDLMASSQIQADTSTWVHTLQRIKTKKKIYLVEYVVITVWHIRSCCHAELAETFPQHLRSNTGNDIPYVLFLMHRELQGNEISHIRCRTGRAQACFI